MDNVVDSDTYHEIMQTCHLLSIDNLQFGANETVNLQFSILAIKYEHLDFSWQVVA